MLLLLLLNPVFWTLLSPFNNQQPMKYSETAQQHYFYCTQGYFHFTCFFQVCSMLPRSAPMVPITTNGAQNNEQRCHQQLGCVRRGAWCPAAVRLHRCCSNMAAGRMSFSFPNLLTLCCIYIIFIVPVFRPFSLAWRFEALILYISAVG